MRMLESEIYEALGADEGPIERTERVAFEQGKEGCKFPAGTGKTLFQQVRAIANASFGRRVLIKAANLKRADMWVDRTRRMCESLDCGIDPKFITAGGGEHIDVEIQVEPLPDEWSG